MMIRKNEQPMGNASIRLLLSASLISLGLATALPAYAQDTVPDTEEDEMVVTGIRQSILNAQDIKRNADTFLDAISASDLDSLPDRSVSEALQRVPGVNVLRFSSPNDPDHFSVEGSGVVIRGLPFVRSELNGRDVFAANSGGVLGFEDISPELLGVIKIFKNQSADLIEGGIAGTIDLNTRLPFDTDGLTAGFSLELNYGDKAERGTPSGSAILSNTWDTDAGRFGLLANISGSQLRSRADSTQIANFQPDDEGNFVPLGGGIRRQDFDRRRSGYSVAGQWESVDEKWLATAQFFRSDSTLEWGENVVQTQQDSTNDRSAGRIDQADFVFDDDGVFQTGTIVETGTWRGPNATAATLLPQNTGGQQQASTRSFREEDTTDDFGFNLKYAPKDNLRFNLDAQYIDSSADITQTEVIRSFFSPVQIGAEENGVPTVTFLVPEGGDSDFFADGNSQFIRALADQRTSNDAEAVAFRGDVEYDFSGDGWLKSVRSGVRYSDQDTTIRQSDFNWGNISEVWTGLDAQQPPGVRGFNEIETLAFVSGNSNPEIDAFLAPFFGQVDFDGFQRGNADTIGFDSIVAYIGPGANDPDAFDDFRRNLTALTNGVTGSRAFCGAAFVPLSDRECTNGDQLIEGTPFTESEVGGVSRDTFAAYTRLDFGSDDLNGSGISLDGNIGVRFVTTDRTVDTVQLAPAFAGLFNEFVNDRDICVNGRPGDADEPSELPGFCQLDLASIEAQLGGGSILRQPESTSYSEFLPSLNLKFGISDEHIVRAAVSRTLTRPSISEVNQRPTVGTLPDVENIGLSDGLFFDGTAVPDGFEVNGFGGFVGRFSGNAELLPQTAWNFDLSYEWYFSDAGSLTLTGFYKNIDNFVTEGALTVIDPETGGDLLIDGRPIAYNTFVNSDENADLTGFEVAYQQFYDFLPGPLSGLGLQANYTYIDANGVENSIDQSLFTGPESDALDPFGPTFDIVDDIFPRVSRHNVNLVGLYENEKWQGRLAYNWRSDFLLTERDVISPFAPIFQESTGQVDGSIFYTINDNFKIGAQGVNLFDDITETTQVINEDGLRAPRSFIRNDRRFSVILRASF